jgi:hypothetical protein
MPSSQSGCPCHFGAVVVDLDYTRPASSVLRLFSPLWEHRLPSSRFSIAPLSVQIHHCATTPNLHSILSIREVRSQPGTVRVQEVSSGPATQRSQSSGCRTRSHPEASSLSLDSGGGQNGRRSCERETPDRFVSCAIIRSASKVHARTVKVVSIRQQLRSPEIKARLDNLRARRFMFPPALSVSAEVPVEEVP